MQDELRALAKLAMMDGAASDHDAELRDLPAKIEAMRGDVQTLETLLAAERAQIDEAKALRDERQKDLQMKIDMLSLAKTKLSKSRTLREADSAEREVEQTRRSIKEREEEVLSIEETLEQKAGSLSERQSQFEEARKMLEEEEAEANARLAVVKKERDKVLAGREKVAENIPKRIFKRYEKLRTKPRYAAVTFVDESGTCKSCRMALPPQLFIEVQRGEDFHECPQCRAFLIHQTFKPEEPVTPKAAVEVSSEASGDEAAEGDEAKAEEKPAESAGADASSSA
jgi:predicted  nucleic acid-binding Zn-ribbon protein